MPVSTVKATASQAPHKIFSGTGGTTYIHIIEYDCRHFAKGDGENDRGYCGMGAGPGKPMCASQLRGNQGCRDQQQPHDDQPVTQNPTHWAHSTR